MSSLESSVQHWQAVVPGRRIEIGLVQVRIAYHRRLSPGYSDQEMKGVKDTVRNSFHAIAEAGGGKLFSWDGDGGAFMFLIEANDSFDNCCLAAIQMLERLPALNQDIRPTPDLARPIEVRISCDAGMVTYDPEPANHPEDFVHKLMKYERQVGAENSVTITERIYRHLTSPLKSRFVSGKYSTELGVDLYSTPPIEAEAGPPDPTDSLSPRAPIEEKPAPSGATTTAREQRPAAGGGLRGLVGHVGPWQMAVVALAAMVVVSLFIVRGVIPSALPPTPPWEEQVHSPEWMTWRKHVHEKLSSAQVTEETLGEALGVMPPTVHNPPAAALRRDEAIGDVLLSYPGVRALLRKRLGIDDQFLGTGLSNPVNAPDYGSASVHEYLIPNLREEDERVWTRKLKLSSLALEKKTVKDLVEKGTEQDGTKQTLKRVIISHAEAKDTGTVVIRFAILDMKKYKGTLGRPESVRVFASDLAEVWNLKVKDAADRSGYTFSGGDTFFVWVFVPGHREEVVPATWGEVLDHLPTWMMQARNRGP